MKMLGQQAPDFSAESTEGTIRLSSYKGRNVILIFYPMDNTPG
jgi:peroxiredoxin Q/BCP